MSLLITENSFMGTTTANAKVVETGYGIRFSFGSNMNTSVMNVQIANNAFTLVARPIHIPPRTISTGGRAEGLKIVGNNIINGITGILAYQSLAVSITGNQISDFVTGISMVGSFDCAITGNGEITADDSCILISSNINSFSERIAIVGNNINSQKAEGSCVRLSNTDATSMVRNISISGNSMRGNGVPTDNSYGVFFAGTFAITDISISGNIFSDVDSSVFFGGIATAGANVGVKIGPNAHALKANGVAVQLPNRMFPRQYYNLNSTTAFTATAGQGSITVDVTNAKFTEKPIYADMVITTATGVRCVYSYDSSTTTSLFFSIQGTISAATHRYVLTASGDSVFGY